MIAGLSYPYTEEQVRALKAGDAVRITGLIHTGRDKFHKWFADGKPVGVDFKNGALFHCGPVVVREEGEWRVKAAGPTTSVRENPYEADFIAASGVRVVIGKGGMDARTLAAMKKHGCIYIQAVGGAAAVAAHSVKRVEGVDFLEEFGAAEACWHFSVENFAGVVAMDAHGVSLFDQVAAVAHKRLHGLIGK